MIVAGVFSGQESVDTRSVDDTGGTARTIVAQWDSGDEEDAFNEVNTGRGTKLRIGDGGGASVSPARSDDDVVNAIDTSGVINPSETGGQISWSNTFGNSTGSTFTIRELLLLMTMADQDNFDRDVGLAHAATTATDVPDGSNATVTYTFEIP